MSCYYNIYLENKFVAMILLDVAMGLKELLHTPHPHPTIHAETDEKQFNFDWL